MHADPPSLSPRASALRGLLWMTVANTLFSVMSISARLASRTASWAAVGAGRALLGACVAAAFALRSGKPLRTKSRGLSWARSIFGTISMLATFYALGQKSLPVGDAVTIFATAPILIALFSPRLLGETPSRGLWGVLLVAFAGVALIAGPRLDVAGAPAASALVAAIFSALAMMFLRKMRAGTQDGTPESAEAIALHFALVSFAVHVVFAAFSFRAPAPRDWIFLFVTGLSGGLAQLAMTQAYAMTEAARLGAISYVGTVISFFAGVVFLDERPSLLQIGGVALVIGAGSVLAVGASRAASRIPAIEPSPDGAR
ncbi:MAG: DMT family transporter [Byssovorax sp.]